MGEFSIYHWLIVAFILLILFGGRKIPELMKGMGEGIRSFKDGLSGKPLPNTPPAKFPEQTSANSTDSKEKS